MVNYMEEYENVSPNKLSDIRLSLVGLIGTLGEHNAQQRINAIDEVLENNVVEIKATKTVRYDYKLSPDAEVARRYIKKAKGSFDRGIDFTLTFVEYRSLLRTKKCFYTGIKLQVEDSTKDDYLTLERIDNSIGYVKGNVKSVCYAANIIKNHLTEQPGGTLNRLSIEQLAKMFTKLASHD